jgi:hypothetical protein
MGCDLPFTRAAIILAVGMLLAVQLPAQISMAGTVRHEGPAEFASGTMGDVGFESGKLILSADRTMLNNWTNMTPSIAPSDRGAYAMACDSAHDNVVLFGGSDGSDSLGDTWTYNLSTNMWTNMHPQTAPMPRKGHAMAYECAHGEVVLFGGGYAQPLNETWTYDQDTNSWTNMNPPTAPPAREGHGL